MILTKNNVHNERITLLAIFRHFWHIPASWEPNVPARDASEISYVITLNFSPSKSTCYCLKSLIHLQKTLLRGLQFQGQIRVIIRFAHPANWRDLETQNALRELNQLGVVFEVLSADDIVQEMQSDGCADPARNMGMARGGGDDFYNFQQTPMYAGILIKMGIMKKGEIWKIMFSNWKSSFFSWHFYKNVWKGTSRKQCE